MQLIIITQDIATEREAETVNELFAKGLQRLHIRKPLFSADDYRHYINIIDSKYHKRLVISGCFELWNEYELGGIHLNSHMRNEPAVWQAIALIPAAAISTSFHTWQEVMDNSFPYSYVFISPVFDSISKRGYSGSIDISRAITVKDHFTENKQYCPGIIGLGGVGQAQLNVLYQNGFDGAAMLGSIWQARDPADTFVSCVQAMELL